MVLSVNRPSPNLAIVTFSEKTSRDTFSEGTIEIVIETLDDLIEDQEIDAVVVTGSGKFFSAGGPVDKFDRAIDEGTIRGVVESMTGHLHPLLLRIRKSSTVFVGALNGAAAGGGLGLALSMDYRISSHEAKLAAVARFEEAVRGGEQRWLAVYHDEDERRIQSSVQRTGYR